MNIEFNSDIQAFLKRCEYNITHSEYNLLLDVDLKQTGYDVVINALEELNYPEFVGKKELWPSLYISSDDFLKSPFHQKINFTDIKEADVSFKWIELAADQLFNYKGIQADSKKELNDWIIFRALDKNIKTLSLAINDDIWMLDVPSESATIDPSALKAKGHVLSFGLGIGYFVYMASLNKDVKSITVIERNHRVIELFKHYILPQFKAKIDINIIEGDAFGYFNEMYLNNFDYVFVDIYQSNDDGLDIEMKLLEQFNPPFDQCDFWIENSICEVLPALIFVYLKAKLKNQSLKHPEPFYLKLLKKIEKNFDELDLTISDVQTLKDLMYDRKLHRQILSTQI